MKTIAVQWELVEGTTLDVTRCCGERRTMRTCTSPPTNQEPPTGNNVLMSLVWNAGGRSDMEYTDCTGSLRKLTRFVVSLVLLRLAYVMADYHICYARLSKHVATAFHTPWCVACHGRFGASAVCQNIGLQYLHAQVCNSKVTVVQWRTAKSVPLEYHG